MKTRHVHHEHFYCKRKHKTNTSLRRRVESTRIVKLNNWWCFKLILEFDDVEYKES